MARTRSDKFDDIKRDILAKSARVFGAKGYERSSINDLIDACGLSRGALYHYFQSKEAILFELLDTHVRGLLGRLDEAVAVPGNPVERLSRAIETIVLYNAGSVSEVLTLLNDLESLSKPEQQDIIKLERKIVALMADLLVAVDTTGKITSRTKSVYTMMLFGIVNYTYTWYNPAKSVPPDEMARLATDLFLNGFLSAPAKARPKGLRPTLVAAQPRTAAR